MADDPLPDRSVSRFELVKKLGAVSWSIVGAIIATALLAAGMTAISGILIPLVVAVVLGTVLEPLITLFMRLHAPRILAAVLSLAITIATAIGVGYLVFWGFALQLPEISQQLHQGWGRAAEWIQSLHIDSAWLEQIRHTIEAYAPKAGLGLLGFLTTTAYGVVTFGVGLVFALFFLFFVLRDGRRFPGWLARTMTSDPELVERLDSAAQGSLRGYFKGTALTAIITGPIFVVPLIVLSIPLIVPIILLYFFLSFVPYLGAWITGAFAVLIAFGSGGPSAAAIVGVSLLISNGAVQSIVNSWALGSSLKLHPVMVLLATLVGGTVAGILGMILGAPLVAAAQRSIAVLREHRTHMISREAGSDERVGSITAE